MNERRRHPRVRLNAEFAAIVDEQLAYIEDLSLDGAFLRTPRATDIGREVELRASLVLDDIYVFEGFARVVGQSRTPKGSRGLHLEFLRLSPEMRSRIERALAFCAVRHRLAKNDPQAIAVWNALHEPVDASPSFDAHVLSQPSLLEPAQAADQRILRRTLLSRRENRSSAFQSSVEAAKAAPPRQRPIATPLVSPSRPPPHDAQPGAKAGTSAAPEKIESPSVLSKITAPNSQLGRPTRIPARAVSTANPRAKTSKAANLGPRSPTLSAPLSVSEVDAWEAALTPFADVEPPVAAAKAAPKRDAIARQAGPAGRSEEEVTQIFSLIPQPEPNGPTISSKMPRKTPNPSQDTPIPAHLRLPSPDEDFI